MKKTVLQYISFLSILLFSAGLTSCIVVNETITHVDCDSKYNGAIDLDITSPYTTITNIDWSNNATTEDIGFLSAGDYEVKIDALSTIFGNNTIHKIHDYYVGYNVLLKDDQVIPNEYSNELNNFSGNAFSENILSLSAGGFIEFEYTKGNFAGGFIEEGQNALTGIPSLGIVSLGSTNSTFYLSTSNGVVSQAPIIVSNTANNKQIFRIEEIGGNIKIYHNGNLIESYPHTFTEDLQFMVSATEASLKGIHASFGNCPLDVESKIDNCINQTIDNKKNWVAQWGYDDDENIISASKGYFDDMGRPTQAQTINVEDNLIWASETKYDAYGRAAISTNAAPIMNEKFCYKENFMKSAVTGNDYDIDDFDTDLTKNNPNAVDDTEAGTLGWYYSDNNTLEPYQATTDYPYSRTVFFNEPFGSVKQVSGASDAFKMGSNHLGKSFIMPIKGELYNCYGLKSPFVSTNVNGNQLNLNTRTLLNGVKSISVDPHGQETVTFADLEGNVLASAYSGALDGSNQGVQDVAASVNRDEYIDIHIPAGCENSLTVSVTNGPPTFSALTMDIYDIDANFELVTWTVGSTTSGETAIDGLAPGYYRVHYKMFGSGLNLKYQLNYYDFSLNYYDIAGRLIMSVPPEGVDCNPLTYDVTIDEHCKTLNSFYYRANNALDHYDQTYGIQVPLAQTNDIQNSTITFSVSNNTSGCENTPNCIEDGTSGGNGSGGTSSKSMMTSSGTSTETNQQNLKTLSAKGSTSGTSKAQQPEGGGGSACPISEFYELKYEIFTQDVNSGEQSLGFKTFLFRNCANCGIWSTNGFELVGGQDFQIELDPIQSQTINEITYRLKDVSKYLADCNYDKLPSTSTAQIAFSENNISPCDVTFFPSYSLHVDRKTNVFQNVTANAHTMQNTYGYDALGNMIWKDNPDENTTEYLYTREGEIRFSQNALQRENGRFSYTNYDGLGRIKEVGEYDASIGTSSDWITNVNNGEVLYFKSGVFDLPITLTEDLTAEINQPGILNVEGTIPSSMSGNLPIKEVTKYYYDAPPSPLTDAIAASDLTNISRTQKFLSAAVSYTEKDKDNDGTDEYATYYSYDIQGRVEWIVQKTDLGLKTIDYEYDLMSNVLSSTYQQGQADEFKHIYEYDKINRLVAVRTQDEAGNNELQAAYKYYLHGPLKRVEIADNLQGVDFVYTAEGMLKSINHPNLRKEDDPGADTDDLFGMAIDYYSGDYKRANANLDNTGLAITGFDDQYNGNIRDIRWNTDGLSNISGTNIIQAPNPNASKYVKQNIYSFTYNQKNWLTSAVAGNIEAYTNKKVAVQCRTCPNPNTMTLPSFGIYEQSLRWKVDNLSYDKNGNILSLDRTGSQVAGSSPFNIAKSIDQLSYNYKTGTNQLLYLQDGITNNLTDNIGDLQNQTTGNYEYNSIGQLTKDFGEDNFIEYDVYGKVSAVWNKDKTYKKASYEYDNNGFRVKKTLYEQIAAIPPSESNPMGTPQLETKRTYYVRDANGTVLNILEWEYDISGSNPWHVETPIYGTGRLGVRYATVNSSNFSGLNIGSSVYELTDHLGNVRASFSRDATTGLLVKESHADYYPFGWVMPGRELVSSNKYRFGYQGQFSEKDEETGWNSFELRSLDTRIGRWMATDPAGQYFSPFVSMGNNPMNGVDPDGAWVKGAGFFRNVFRSDGWNNARLTAINNGGTFTKTGHLTFESVYWSGTSEYSNTDKYRGAQVLNITEFKAKPPFVLDFASNMSRSVVNSFTQVGSGIVSPIINTAVLGFRGKLSIHYTSSSDSDYRKYGWKAAGVYKFEEGWKWSRYLDVDSDLTGSYGFHNGGKQLLGATTDVVLTPFSSSVVVFKGSGLVHTGLNKVVNGGIKTGAKKVIKGSMELVPEN